ncbi:hypothetical protein [Marinobacter alexandrii]|uniref:hypothetical protein n=1 Tax=Marinobacter alexandrii TaxID=2570351 RepID=UPI001D19023A|nr:hypothetical protein [Marinobacter alexandrii]
MIRLKLSPLTESATLLRRGGVVLGSVGLTALYSLLILLRALLRLEELLGDGEAE